LSNLIISGQLSREIALEEIVKPSYDQEKKDELISFVLKKLGFSEEEFLKIINAPNKTFRDYPSRAKLFRWILNLKKLLRN
jgi:hypothetical protein